MIIEGSLSVKAALKGNKRTVETVIIDKTKKCKDSTYIKKLAQQQGVSVVLMERYQINEMATGKTHGGVIAKVSNRSYDTLEKCFEKENFTVLIEGVEDPYNLGYIFRTLYSVNCSGVILKKRDLSNAEATILKASAGAFEMLPVHLSDDLSSVIAYAKEKNITVLSAMRKHAISYFECDLKKDILICIGGEMRGLSKEVLDNSDQNIYIPYGNDFKNALNASSAIAVISYEVLRQRLFNN